jgi:hypothetical protein
MIRIVELERLRRRFQQLVIRFRQTTPLYLTIQYLSADFLRGCLLFNTNALANLVARPTRANVRKPVATVSRIRRRHDVEGIRIF